jgi:chromate transporter
VATALALAGVDELLVLALGAGCGAVLLERDGGPPRWQGSRRGAWRGAWRRLRALGRGGPAALLGALLALPALLAATAPAPVAPPALLARLWWEFLRFGATLFGSGYLLVAYLQSRLVEDLGLLSTAQLLEAIVIGEMTPGPLFTTSTAVGYLVGGMAGALLATTAIFLPSFPLAMLLGRAMPRVKRSALARTVMRGLAAAVVGVMLAVSIRLGMRVVVDLPSAAVLASAMAALRFTRLPPLALVPLGAMVGIGLRTLGV